MALEQNTPREEFTSRILAVWTCDLSKPDPARWRTTNWAACNPALRMRGALPIRLDEETAFHAAHEGRAARPPVFATAAIQLCLSIRVLFSPPLRQTAGTVASLLRPAGPDGPVPDFPTDCRGQKTQIRKAAA